MNTFEAYTPAASYLRLATACPEVAVGDVRTNVERICSLYAEAASQDAALVVFPELSITGYTLGDLVQQNQLLAAAEHGVQALASVTTDTQTAMVVGLPLRFGNRLYNCAAVLAGGKVQGIVPKTHLPTYNEFYEGRWYDSWPYENTTMQMGGHEVPFGTDLLFSVGGTTAGVEICEDLWVDEPPSIKQAQRGAVVIANPSASPEQIGKFDGRRDLVRMHSGQLRVAYAYAGCHPTESTADVVMGGHQIIAANGIIQAERPPFGSAAVTLADIDIDHLEHDRRKQHMAQKLGGLLVQTEVRRSQEGLLEKPERSPFLPGKEAAGKRDARLEMALNIQAYGLAMRLRASRQERVVLGLSGGLDSTLALLVAVRAAAVLSRQPGDMIRTLTMPGPASSPATQDNAQLLAEQLGVQNEVVPIDQLVALELASLGHDGRTQDITYENVQARARTSLLMNYANLHGAMVLGTGDLSEIALGWCTYNGDQQSHYNVNASIPKTLVKHLVRYASQQPECRAERQTLDAVLETVVSPELTKAGGDAISQSTESIIGPYELHDFFLYHVVRWGDSAAKIRYLAEQAFSGDYGAGEVEKWFGVFIRRFVGNQFKRQNMPDGPKVGSVSLSPRGDWRMPPDLYNAALWDDRG